MEWRIESSGTDRGIGKLLKDRRRKAEGRRRMIEGRRRGFSLIKLVIVIAILSLIGVFGSQMFLETTQVFLEARGRRDVVQEARYAIERMSREIREGIDTPSDIITFTASTFTYIDPNSVTISFTRSGSNLLRNTDVLAGNVSALTFTYLRDNGSIATLTSQIWRIQISLTLQVGNADVTLETQVFPRNFYNDNTNFASWAEQ